MRIQLPSTRIRCIRQQTSPQLFESALLLDLSFKSYNVCAVKPTLLSFFPCRTVELGAVNEPKVALQISWRSESASGYVSVDGQIRFEYGYVWRWLKNIRIRVERADPRDCTKLWVGITGLKNLIGDLRFRLIYVPSRLYKSAFIFFHYLVQMCWYMQCV